MIGFLLRKLARWSYRYDLTKQAIRDEIDAAFLEESVADFRKLQEAEQAQIETKQARIKELENEHKYELRREREKLEDEVEQHAKHIEEINEKITDIHKAVQHKRAVAEATKMRISSMA